MSKKDLVSLYNNPNVDGSLGGVARFAEAQGIPVQEAKRILSKDLSYTLHRPRRKRFPKARVIVYGIDHQWVADLIDVQSLRRNNKGYKYLLTVVDALSKFLWVVPLKNKTGTELVRAFQSILAKGRKPIQLQTDQGKEFYNKTFETFLKEKKIHLFSTYGDDKAAMAERVNRTIKERIYRYLTSANTLRYENVLQAIVRGYNRSKHRSIGMAPKDVTFANEKTVWNRLYGKTNRSIRPQFQRGDRVRLNEKHRVFKKGYLPGWTEEVFLVDLVNKTTVPTYRIKEWDGTVIRGTFYNEDLQKVTIPDDHVFRIDKVIKRQKNQVLVRWKGWPSKYDTWMSKKDIKVLRDKQSTSLLQAQSK